MKQYDIKNLNPAFEIFESNEKYGLKMNGKELLKPEYDFIWCILPNKMGGIRKGEQFGIINEKGEIVHQPEFNARSTKIYTMDEYNDPKFQKLLSEKEEFIISNALATLVDEEGNEEEDVYHMSYWVGFDNIQLDKSGVHFYLSNYNIWLRDNGKLELKFYTNTKHLNGKYLSAVEDNGKAGIITEEEHDIVEDFLYDEVRFHVDKNMAELLIDGKIVKTVSLPQTE